MRYALTVWPVRKALVVGEHVRVRTLGDEVFVLADDEDKHAPMLARLDGTPHGREPWEQLTPASAPTSPVAEDCTSDRFRKAWQFLQDHLLNEIACGEPEGQEALNIINAIMDRLTARKEVGRAG